MLDSDTGAAGHGLMAIAAKNAARGGADLAGAADAARRLRERMKIIFAVDTLEYLRRGGRIGGGAGVGRLGAEDQADPLDRPRDPADRARAHRRPRVRAAGRAPGQPARETAPTCSSSSTSRRTTSPTGSPSAAREIYGRPPEFVSELGPVIGAHVGPGLFGVTGLPGSVLGPV